MTCKSLRQRPVEPPSSACFDCGAMVPVTEAWYSARNPEIALCETCFRRRELRRKARSRVRKRPSATG